MRCLPCLLIALLAACSSSSGVTGDSQVAPAEAGMEASIDGAPDAGSPDSSLPDARPPDAAADSQSFADTSTDASATFPPGAGGCMATQGSLTQLGATGNVTVYDGCMGVGGASRYLLVWGGSVGNLSQSSLSAIKATHSADLLAIPGVQGHGITSCCVPSTNSACISIYVAANTSSVWDLARALDKVLVGEPDCFGIVADVPGNLGPRCQQNDPECLPIPICDSSTSFDPVCCTVPPYDPGAARVPTLGSSSPLLSLEQPQAAGECTHDGECVLNGCGNHCVAYTAPSMVAICPCYPALKDSFCGCVGGACVWYEQK